MEPAKIEEVELQIAGQAAHSSIVAPVPPPQTKWKKLKKGFKEGVGDFCGLLEEEEHAEDKDKWQNRAQALTTSRLVGVKKTHPLRDNVRGGLDMTDQDEVDGLLQKYLNVTCQFAEVNLIKEIRLRQRKCFSGEPLTTRDPARRCVRPKPKGKQQKDHLLVMAYKGIKDFINPPKKSRKLAPTLHSRSFAPSDISAYGRVTTALDDVDGSQDAILDDMFFTTTSSTYPVIPPTSLEEKSVFKRRVEEEDGLYEEAVSTEGWDEPDLRHERERPIQIDEEKYRPSNKYQWKERGGWMYREPVHADQPDVGFEPGTRMVNSVKNALFDNADRWDVTRSKVMQAFDEGCLTKIFGFKLDQFYKYRYVEGQYVADRRNDHRTGFTLWLTFIQVLIFIVSVSVYGIAPFGVEVRTISKEIIQPNLALEKVSFLEQENFWIGPRQADLIHLGAKFSPCMRKDANIEAAIFMDHKRESETACCINNDGSGCLQTKESKCSRTLATWYKWSPKNPVMRDINRTSGSVCGQDPLYCKSPISHGPFLWANDISKWPICWESTEGNEPHMHCDITGQPCCFGIQGECMITTREHCSFIRGYFHEEAKLCSQVSCMNEICGMLPFLKPEVPDQFYRLWLSLFLHAGVFHVLITILFNLLVLWPIERMTGWIRVLVIYLGSGMTGSLASSIFLPYYVEAGPAGAQFGILACHLVTVILFVKYPKEAILKLLGLILVLLILGLLPMIDNYAHLFGFIFGFLISFAILPFARVKKGTTHVRTQRIIAIVVCSLLAVGLCTVLIVLFYVAPIYSCPYCQYFNCIPITSSFCNNMEVKVRTEATY